MKKIVNNVFYILTSLLLLIYVIGPSSIWISAMQLYNGVEVQKKDYSIELPENWMIYDTSCSSECTSIVGHSSDGWDNNLFYVNLYEMGFAPESLLSKWTECDERKLYPITTYQGIGLGLYLCSFDLNNSTKPKAALTLNDKTGKIIAAAHNWKPYYLEEYLELFKSIKVKENSSIQEITWTKQNE